MINGKPPNGDVRRTDPEFDDRPERETPLTEPTLASKMCIVIAFDIPTDSVNDSYEKSSGILRQVKGALSEQPNLQIWGAINEVASAIVHVLNEGVEQQESGD